MRLRFLIAGFAVALLAACDAATTTPEPGAGFRELPADHVMLDVEQYMTDDGVRRGELHADTAYVYVDSAKVELRKVHLLLFNPDGQQSADLTSRKGALDQRTNAMVARGDVILVARQGSRRIETQELHYDPNSHRIWSDVSTTMQQNGTRVTGDGFTADDQMQNVQITHPRGRVQGLKVTF